MSDLQRVLLAVSIAGLVGGVINALSTDNGFALPKRETTTGGARIVRPGFVGNILFGVVSALMLFALYGPLRDVVVTGERPTDGGDETAPPDSLSLSALGGAVITGIGGARLITGEVDKRLLKAAASEAAGSVASQPSGAQIAVATPAGALEIAKEMPTPDRAAGDGGSGDPQPAPRAGSTS